MATGAAVTVAGKSMGVTVTVSRARPSSGSTPGRLRKDFLARLAMDVEGRRRGCGCMGGLSWDEEKLSGLARSRARGARSCRPENISDHQTSMGIDLQSLNGCLRRMQHLPRLRSRAASLPTEAYEVSHGSGPTSLSGSVF